MIANTPKPPYYAVIFTSVRTEGNNNYDITSKKMFDLAHQQKGFLGIESARDVIGITVSYWDSLEAVKAWKMNTEHKLAQKNGKNIWYKSFKVRICKVEKDYGFEI